MTDQLPIAPAPPVLSASPSTTIVKQDEDYDAIQSRNVHLNSAETCAHKDDSL